MLLKNSILKTVSASAISLILIGASLTTPSWAMNEKEGEDKKGKCIKVNGWDWVKDTDTISFKEFCNRGMQNPTVRFENVMELNKEFLSDLLTNTHITSLSIKDCPLDGKCTNALGNALQTNSTLTGLTMHGNSYSMGYRGGYNSCNDTPTLLGQSLIELNLESNMIGEKGAQAIATFLETNTKLKTLSLNCNKIGVEGAKAIAAGLKVNSSLRTLSLYGNDIQSTGSQTIGAALQDNTTLWLLRHQIRFETLYQKPIFV